jgi:Tfp pilus assembly protein PilV
MNPPVNDSSTDSAIWLDLVGANQGWLKRCRAAASGNPTALAELTDDNSPAARALHTGVTRTAPAPTGDPLAPLVSYDWQVAIALRSLTLALAGQLDPREGVDAIFRLADQANLAHGAGTPTTSASADTTAEDAYPAGIDDAVTGVMREIRSRHHNQASPFVELLALDLSGNFPSTVDTITVPVVFAGDTRDALGPGGTGGGATGKLTLELLSGGPPGLHPNPGSMCFLRADSGFTASIGQAWACAPTRLKAACITWTLRLGTDAAQPVTSIIGGSLAAAVAVALNELTTHKWIRRSLQPRNLDPRCAITAAVADQTGALTGVTGLDRKVAAAADAKLRLIVADQDLDTAQQTLHGNEVQIRGAATVHDATRLARGHLNGRFRTTIGAIALSVLILGVGVTAVGVTNQRHAAQQAAAQRVIESEQLTDRSADLLRTNPQLAALTALAAYQTNPTPQTTTAMATAISYNPNNAQVTAIPKSHSAAIGPTAAWLSTEHGIVAYSLTTMQPLNQPMPTTDDNGRSESVELTLSRKGDRLAALSSTTITVYSIDQQNRLTKISSVPRPGGRISDLKIFVNFSPDGQRLLVTNLYGQCWLWHPETKAQPSKLVVGFKLPKDGDEGIRHVVDEDGHKSWTVLVTLETDDRNEILRLNLLKGTLDIVGESSNHDPANDGEFWKTVSTGSGAILSSKRTGGFSRFDGKKWEQFQSATSEGVENIAVSESNEIAITHGPYISLLGLSDDMSGDTSKFDIFTAGQEHSFDSLQYIGAHELVAIDPTGQMIVIDTAANHNQRVPASKFDISPAGDATVTAKDGKQIEVNHNSGYSHTTPIGPVVGTYSASVPGRQSMRGTLFQSDNVAISQKFIGAAGGIISDEPPPPGYRWAANEGGFVALWELNNRRLILRDRCQDPNVRSHTLIKISPNEDMLFAAQGAIICRWQLPMGNRLPNIDLAANRDFKSFRDSPPAVRQLSLGRSYLAVPSSKVYTIETATGHRREVPGAFSSAAIASNGESLALMDDEGNLTIMSVSPLVEIRKIDIQDRGAQLAWSPDSSQIAIWKNDGTLQVVDPASGLQTLPPIFESEDNVLGYSYGAELSWRSPRIVILDRGFRLKTVDLSQHPDWKKRICTTASGLTESQWRANVGPSIPYRDPCA